ncbi:MAG TPA: DUF418 domain-containing protein [Terriglobia bacterium]|nr:DUF418 domain-containing protein [Terriglobia bacterium]
MTSPAAAAGYAPASPAAARPPRLDSLDLLRGIAILGIFLMNSQAMSMPTMAYFNPIAYDPARYSDPNYAGLSPLNYAVWIVTHIVADLKFITIFSALFGAGILLQGERLAARGAPATAVHYMRMLVLLVFGVAHAHLFWYGDVLANYAICGMLLFPFRRLRPTALALAGVALISVATLYNYVDNNNIEIRAARWLHDGSTRLTAGATGVDFEYEAYSGGWKEAARTRSWVALDNETFSFLNWALWRCGGAMLVGMALLGYGFFHGAWPRPAYLALAALAIPSGWIMTGMGVLYNDAHGWFDGGYPDFFGMQFNYWGSFVSGMGYLALGTLVAARIADNNSALLTRVARPIRAVGRAALSNYILQSVIGTTIFYGYGLGYFGWVSRAGLIPIVLATWAFQLTVSALWLRRFKQGPLEWLWHRMVYGVLGRSRDSAAPA